ncbi:iporin [Pygocentrus nattereri]|uniref:iporin n=1 Tax=Pygocentrus nattereri TaxID=42514 RepID=UPI000814667E|nr:iporin [Pygocentrus nattereri]
MAASAKLSGETLIVRHIPLAHGQSVGFQLYSSATRPTRPCSLKLTHSISLPEREEPPKEALDSDFQSHSSKSSSNDEAVNTGHSAENTKRYSSSLNSQLSPPQSKLEFTGCRSTSRWQNPFLPDLEVHEDEEEDDDSDGDNLHKYREGSSFQLHGNSNGTQDEALGYTTEIWLPCSNQCMVNSPMCSHKLKMLHPDMNPFGTHQEHKQIKSLSDSGLQHRRDSKGTPILMDCEEKEWGDEEDYEAYVLKERAYEKHEGYNYIQSKTSDSESSQKQLEYVSDSSCNSSDGLLVNFSAIYNKANNAVPATPHGLDSPAKDYYGSGSMCQDDDFKPVPCWSPCRVDPNCNIYPLDSDGRASVEISDLTVCLQSQARLMASTQNYYKLVTCDLSSQSSLSPAWSSVTSCSEAHSQGSLTPPTEYFLFRQPEEEEGEVLKVDQSDLQVDEDIELKRSKRTIRDSLKGTKERKAHNTTHNPKSRDPESSNHEYRSATQSQSWEGRWGDSSSPKLEALPRVPSCPSQMNSDLSSCVPKQHITSFAELARCKKGGGDSSSIENSMEAPTCSKFTQNTSPIQRKTPLGPNITLNTNQSTKTSDHSEIYETPSKSEGACASSPEVVRYTKAQRPTFLPIQPFVLQPPSGKHNKGLGSLLNQYISHRHGKPSTSKGTGKCKGLTSYLRPSPLGSYSSMHLDADTGSDTCSTCTPSPVQHHTRTHWAQPSPLLLRDYPEPDERRSSPKMLGPKLTVKSPRADQAHPTVKQSWTGQRENYLKPFLTMQPLQNPCSELVSSLSPVLRVEFIAPKPGTQEQSFQVNHSSSPAITSVTSLTSDTSLKSSQRFWGPSDVLHTDEKLSATSALFGPSFLVKEPHQHNNSVYLTDKSPEEFCLSPDASSEFLSVDLKRGMLKSVSLAVDFITAHFGSGRDSEEKIRLGKSSLCPSISQLVLSQLCPAIRNILQDGLKAFKLDLIIGQRRNKPWSVVEASTQPGPSTRILHSLVSVVRRCSQLTNHSMRVNAFLLGLLNLRALESWLRHLHACTDVVAEYYHHWGFLALSQGPGCKSLFQELLLLLQPLNQLPFDLHLLSEPKLQRKLAKKSSRPLAPSDYPILHKASNQKNNGHPERSKLKEEGDLHPPTQNQSYTSCGTHIAENLKGCAVKFCKQPRPFSPEEKDEQKCLVSSERESAGWWLGQTPITEGMMLGVCSGGAPHEQHKKILVENSESATDGLLQTSQQENPQKGLRWARLFGSGIGTSAGVVRAQQNNQSHRTRLPSQWLKLGASKVDLLAQSVWGRDVSRTLCGPRPKLRQ